MLARFALTLALVLTVAGAAPGAEVIRFKGTTVSFRVEAGAVRGFALTANALCLIAARGGYEIKVIPLAADAKLDGDGRSVGDALGEVTAAEAPFVQVPSHIDVRDGQITLINNDHTILGLRASHDLAPFLPAEYRLLPLLQSVWYVPAGLDIWNQLRGKYPGRYATMKGMNVPPPSYGPVVWNREEAPIPQEGPLD